MVDAARWLLDLTVALVLLILFAIPMVLIALAVHAEDRGPSLFRQERVGLRRGRFVMLKFRTMLPSGDDRALRDLIARELRGEDTVVDGSSKLSNDRRITRTGAFLRRTSLDELPQLINVLRGDMTLVGPRPCLGWEAEMFPPEFAPRFDVPPGLTGLWQVSGRSTLGTLEMLKLDVDYVHAARCARTWASSSGRRRHCCAATARDDYGVHRSVGELVKPMRSPAVPRPAPRGESRNGRSVLFITELDDIPVAALPDPVWAARSSSADPEWIGSAMRARPACRRRGCGTRCCGEFSRLRHLRLRRHPRGRRTPPPRRRLHAERLPNWGRAVQDVLRRRGLPLPRAGRAHLLRAVATGVRRREANACWTPGLFR